MSWFKRHLNWYLFIIVCILQIVGYPLLTFLAGGEGMWDFWIAFAIGIIIYAGVFDYVLSEKGYKKQKDIMSLGWCVLWISGWLGVIVLLIVRNKRG